MTTVTAPLEAESARMSCPPPTARPLAAVFAARDGAPDELLLVVEPTSGRVQAEYHSRGFAGEGVGEVVVNRVRDRSFMVIVRIDIRGIDARNDRDESVHVDAAVTWSLDPVLGSLDVAGTALVFGSDDRELRRLDAVTGHSFDQLDPTSLPESVPGW